jgi:hypothetical protein
VSIALDKVRLRANPAYRAVPWNRAAPEARGALAMDANGYGVLAPQEGTDLPLVAIDRDTALLFLTLQEPGPAPDFVFAANAGEGERALRRLLLDRVLEVEEMGNYVSGPEACALIGVDPAGRRGRLAQLSVEAVCYAAALADADAMTLARKLYRYNTRPVTPMLRRRLPDRAAFVDFLGLGPDGTARRAIDRFCSSSDDDSAWAVFMSRHARGRRPAQPCKLYLGLALEELPDCLSPLVGALECSEATQFKIGVELAGLLRPDKLVIYFPSKEALLATAQALLPIVAGRTVHAVPFSAEIAAGGALSWGIAPETAWFGERASWRQWVCEKLAAALVTARYSNVDGLEPWQFALERLRLEGVDTETFMPTGNWSEAA